MLYCDDWTPSIHEQYRKFALQLIINLFLNTFQYSKISIFFYVYLLDYHSMNDKYSLKVIVQEENYGLYEFCHKVEYILALLANTFLRI